MAAVDPMCWQAWQVAANAVSNWNGFYREGEAGNHQLAIPDGQTVQRKPHAGRPLRIAGHGRQLAGGPARQQVHGERDDQELHGADYYRVCFTKQGFNPATRDWARATSKG